VPQLQAADEAASREDLAEVVKPWQLNGPYKPYKAVGCVDCRMTGFMGRMGLYELLVVSEAFKSQITREPNSDALKRQAVPTACARCDWLACCGWQRV
jgi:general secretion pathway protein E